jgi:hypothetical protein
MTQHGVRLRQQLLAQLPADRPGLGVADVGRQLRHGLGVLVAHGNPQRLNEI